MMWLYDTFVYYPLLNALVVLYDSIAFEDLGLAIIFLTVLIRILLFPLFQKSMRHQVVMQAIQPKLKKVQEEHKNNREEQSRAMLALYKEHHINPFSGFFFILLQLPILIGLYQIFLQSLNSTDFVGLYSFIPHPSTLNATFLNLINLRSPSIVIVALTALAQYIQGRMMLPKKAVAETPSASDIMQRRMVFIGPLLTLLIFFQLPAAVTLYWLTTSVTSVAQQYFINKETSHGTVEPLHKKNN